MTQQTDAGDNYSLGLDLPPRSATRTSSPDDVRTLLALSAIEGLGRVSLGSIFDCFSPLSAVWTASAEDLRPILVKARNRRVEQAITQITEEREFLLDRADRQLRSFEKQRISVLFNSDDAYPSRLKLASGPRWLFVQGAHGLLNRQSTVAVVGTREPTPSGIKRARTVAAELAAKGFVVVSGLADGIDTEVHSAVVESGGETIAVLGNGLSVEFPAGSADLRRKIVQSGGAIITEYLWSERYSRATFIQRNRIQAAISGAVCPVECKRKSGTAHTIRFAVELERLLFGVGTLQSLTAEGNEVVDILADLAAPIFELSSDESLAALWSFLEPISGDVRPAPTDLASQLLSVYGPTLRQLRDILQSRNTSSEERAWVQRIISSILSGTRQEG
jgi:DNA protecting protein DprA